MAAAAATKRSESNGTDGMRPQRPNVKHNSSTANRQRESIWSHFTLGVRQLAEEEEEEASG